MISSLRTYRSLRLVAALVLLLSAGLPLVRYACAQTGSSATALASGRAVSSPSSSCASMPAGVHSRLCEDGSPESLLMDPEDCTTETTCTTDENAQESAVTAPTARAEQQLHPPQASFLTTLAVAFAKPAPQTGAPVRSSRADETRRPSSSAGVPVRLVTSTFLL